MPDTEHEVTTLALFKTRLRVSGDRQSPRRSVRGRGRYLRAISLVYGHLTPNQADCLGGHDSGEGQLGRLRGVEAGTAGHQ